MAIGTNAAIHFFGTADALGTTPATVATGVMSLTGDLSEWTNTDDAPWASVVLEFATSTTGTANRTIDLYLQQLELVGVNDAEVPDVVNFLRHHVGTFYHNNPATTVQYAQVMIALPNNKTQAVYNFYIVNNTGQTIADTWDLTVTPITIGPHA